MKNKQISKYTSELSDHELIEQAKKGDQNALEHLIKRHQDWIFNVAFAFIEDRDEAADITQEVLIKMITHLSSFKSESNFRTWMYRIVKNHFLNVKRKKYEKYTLSFEAFGKGLDRLPDENLSGHYEVEEKVLVKEAQISCMRGMLLCLEPEQRMIYILGELFEFPDSIASEIMEMSKANFRVKLHRARQQLYNFMNHKCGLVNKNNPCRCARKTNSFIKMGYVDPVKLHFQRDTIESIDKMLDSKVNTFNKEVISAYQKLYQEIPFLKSPETINVIEKLISSDLIRKTFNLNFSKN